MKHPLLRGSLLLFSLLPSKGLSITSDGSDSVVRANHMNRSMSSDSLAKIDVYSLTGRPVAPVAGYEHVLSRFFVFEYDFSLSTQNLFLVGVFGVRRFCTFTTADVKES